MPVPILHRSNIQNLHSQNKTHKGKLQVSIKDSKTCTNKAKPIYQTENANQRFKLYTVKAKPR